MKLNLVDSHIDEVKTEAVVIMLTEEQLKSHGVESKLVDTIDRAIAREDFRAESGRVVSSYVDKNLNTDLVALVGLGKEKKLNIDSFRKALSKAVDEMKNNKVNEFAVMIPEFDNLNFDETVIAVAEGALLSNYVFKKYKQENKDKIHLIKQISLVHNWKGKKSEYERVVEKTRIICENTMLARDLVNENADVATPEHIAEIAVKLSDENLECTVIDEKELKSLGMGLHMAVGQGSRFPPRLVIMKYYGDKSSDKKTALIGKGITFDSGGLNIKPTGYMETMKTDMSGASAVLYTMKTLRDLKIKANVIGLLALAENMVGPNSYKPGDVVKSYSGLTVEIGNTDAEGRLVMADAISYAKEKFEPDLIIDIATLTGSIVGTFGGYIIGLFTNDDETAGSLHNSGEITYERTWRLPVYDEYSNEIKSDIADVNNVSQSRYAGAITGAAFLQRFYEDSKWVHLDIAGMAWMEKRRNYLPKGATGVGVRLLTTYFEKFSK